MLGKFNIVPTVNIKEREPVHLGVQVLAFGHGQGF